MISKEEYIGKLKELASNPGNIEGIYNYCDRWCERCMFTSKCLNFKIQDAAGFDKDLDNANFWENLHLIFDATRQMLEEDMERFGIKPEDLQQEIENSNEPDNEFEQTERHPLTQKAREMGLSVMKWLESFQKQNEKLIEMGIDPNENKPTLKNAIEVIGWYSLFISAKIHRAVSHFYDKFKDEFMKYDSDGSAKITLVAIDRSIEAWTFLYSQLPSDEEIILNYLVDLSSIREQTESLFPDARKFVRPGFDEVYEEV
jgi:hypothetical protein